MEGERDRAQRRVCQAGHGFRTGCGPSNRIATVYLPGREGPAAIYVVAGLVRIDGYEGFSGAVMSEDRVDAPVPWDVILGGGR